MSPMTLGSTEISRANSRLLRYTTQTEVENQGTIQICA